MKSIDINCDAGERLGNAGLLADEALFPYVSSVNIACGFHAGGPGIMMSTIEAALRAGLQIGAHPGLPDRTGFGRRWMDVSARDLYIDTLVQVGALCTLAKASGTRVHHVKPHGALYHGLGQSELLAEAFVQAIGDIDSKLEIVGLPGSKLLMVAKAAGLRTVREGFIDRKYREDGTLVPRTEPNSVHADIHTAVEQARRLAAGEPVFMNENEQTMVNVDTICLHSDTPEAQRFAEAVYRSLSADGIRIKSMQHEQEEA